MEVESGEAPMLLALKVTYVSCHFAFSLGEKFFQIPIDNKVEITFHYKTVFTLVRRVSGEFKYLQIFPYHFCYTLVFVLVCMRNLTFSLSVNKIASSVLESIFSCVLACDLVENE